ncbi:GM13353 [Drosophila sechellia]|uniref:GM13353 n=1 Tax=Drosophila sechellia TaxID=7238 RepID=B4IEV5_DROSE|nr:GM13353 [Drosophila sechellia]
MGTTQTVSPAAGKDKTNDTSKGSPSKAKSNGQVQGKTKNKEVNALPPQKSVVIAYLCWLFGGIFGLHHLYLHRDRHAFIWWCTLGGYMGIGWMGELFLIPEYVRDANEDPKFVKMFVAKLQAYPKPPYSSKRFVGQVMIGHLFGQVCSMAIPETLVVGWDLSFLHWAIPLFVSLGVWLVGNIWPGAGCMVGTALLAAYLAYPARYLIYDETYSVLAHWSPAYSVLSKIKSNRRRKNKQYQEEEAIVL